MGQSQALDAAGDLFADRYLIEQTLGEGAMGTIHRALDTATGTRVALKHLKLEAEAGAEERVALFQREYHSLEQLAHPRIIRVYDFGFSDGRPYYTMELLDGEDLRELAPLAPLRACALLRDVASSLAIVHSRRLVYRDLSPRNVRCTSDGRAKLLDFGALTPLGVPRQIVGTPAFTPPEAIYGQPLDARADLYSLGALAYWALTGSPPYRVRELGELRDAWRTRPTPPSALVSAVPEALSALIMSLLSQNPTGRPQHAEEVIERLSAIAQLPPDRDLGVMRAYLTTPELVGRDEEVLRFRKALLRATRGRGSALLVRAQPGGGSTRLLDACVLEAKLVGVLVARADPAGRAHEEFAALRAASAQWAEALPAALAERLQACMERPQPTARDPNGEGVHARMAAAILELARERSLLLAVDEAQHIDSASVVVFALLARAAARHKLVICGSLLADHDPRDSLPLRMLIEASTAVELQAWRLPQTEALLRSLFGAAASVPLLADRIHRVALGNPRDTMQLAQHLIDTGVVRHQDGAWALPMKLDEVALPVDMMQAQRRVVSTLDEASRDLAGMLALEPELDQLTLSDCQRLSPDALRLLDGLVRAGVLLPHGTGFAFRHGGFAAAVIESLDPAQRRELHLRLVSMHEAGGHHPLSIAYQLHHAGQHEACLRRVQSWLAPEGYVRLTAHQAGLLDLIVSDTAHYPLSAAERYPLRALLVQHAALLEPEFGRHGELSFQQLRQETGLCYWDEYAGLAPLERISSCLQRAQAAFDATPEAQRGLSPGDAVRELAVLVRSMTSVYARTLEADKLIALADWLAPLCPLAPIMQLLYELTLTSADRAVREKRVSHRFLDYAARFEQPLYGVDDLVRRSASAICVYIAALDEAKQGKPSALSRVEPLEQMPSFAALAWHVRMLSHIYSGRTAEAARCRESMELLVIEQDRPITLLAMSVLYEAWGYELCEDSTGLKGALEQVEHEARRYPGWQPWAVLYRGDLSRLRGDLDAALTDYEQAAANTAPGKHQVWPHAAERRVVVLRQLGRLEESLALGRASVQHAEQEDLEPVNLLRSYLALALTEAEAGLLDEAGGHVVAALSCAEREGIGGVALGIVHEAQARLALRMKDMPAFRRASQACASCLLGGDNPALTAKYERLLQQGRAAGLVQALPPTAAETALHARLGAARDQRESALAVLEILAGQLGTQAGCLFGVTERGPSLLAQLGASGQAAELQAMAAAYLAAELTDTQMVTVTQHDERAAQGRPSLSTSDGATYVPALLRGQRASRTFIAGLALLRLDPGPQVGARSGLLDTLGQALLDSDANSGMLEAS